MFQGSVQGFGGSLRFFYDNFTLLKGNQDLLISCPDFLWIQKVERK